MSGNTDDNQRNATSPHPPVPADTAPEVGDGDAVDLDGGDLCVLGGLPPGCIASSAASYASESSAVAATADDVATASG